MIMGQRSIEFISLVGTRSDWKLGLYQYKLTILEQNLINGHAE
jgi:hypothetical protein